MHIADILKDQKPTLSFEFFPPKSAEASEALFATIGELEAYKPAFVSVTYGAGGSTRELTHDLVVRIKKTTSLDPVPHLTCVCHSEADVASITKAEVDQLARMYLDPSRLSRAVVIPAAPSAQAPAKPVVNTP